MDVDRSRLAASALLSCLLVLLLQSPTEAQILCSARTDVYVAENLTAGVVVETIAVEAGVTLALKPTAAQAPFELVQNQLRTTEVLDFEVTPRYIINIVCSQEETSATLDLVIIVLVTNVNDNPPVFSQGLYRADVSEMSPVDAPVGSFPATDRDNLGPLYYTLTSGADQFKLRSTTNPEVLVNKLLEYDKVKSVQLVLEVQDTPLAPPVEPSFSSTATIVVTVTDRDDRPPWFQPCSRQEVGGAVVCLGPGYTGRVDHNEQAPGVLQLKPGPLYAVDGDSGINEGVTYRFLSGNDDGVFAISPSTGNISMLKPSGALGTVTLTVMAAQTVNTHQFSTTSVAISVQVKSLHPPQFQQPVYEAVVTGVGAMALDPNKEDEPLRIVATDGDYGSGGVNPHLSISIKGTSDFALIDGFLFMMKDLPDATFTLQVVALDASTDESDTADLTVTVATEIAPSGRFGAADMAALGATLGALLFLCALVIGALVRRTRNDKAAWRKIHEASAFRTGQRAGGRQRGHSVQQRGVRGRRRRRQQLQLLLGRRRIRRRVASDARAAAAQRGRRPVRGAAPPPPARRRQPGRLGRGRQREGGEAHPDQGAAPGGRVQGRVVQGGHRPQHTGGGRDPGQRGRARRGAEGGSGQWDRSEDGRGRSGLHGQQRRPVGALRHTGSTHNKS
ncbi:cadherin-related family member 5-like isoform X3 [Betta splendens]|uniref:Cadherin-related family member 5-like isoform X3 n=1 Tax=Betta splendens TaxID=158456 RepID=A0A6P7MRG0_BETSP|nr:cadherin-related family member 5-like isoform X3 [Betta splendens]